MPSARRRPCAGSAISQRPVSMATATAVGSMRTPCPRRPRTAAGGGWQAEEDWLRFADRRAVDVFRLAGIYGPRRSAFDDLRAGTARRVSRPGHAFGRIHRDDIVRAVMAAMRQDATVWRTRPQSGGRRTRGERRRGGGGGAAARRRRARSSAIRARTGRDEPDGAQLLGGEPQGVPAGGRSRRSACAGSIRAIARDYAPSWPRSGASVRRSSARSCGRDSRWSPSFTRIT